MFQNSDHLPRWVPATTPNLNPIAVGSAKWFDPSRRSRKPKLPTEVVEGGRGFTPFAPTDRVVAAAAALVDRQTDGVCNQNPLGTEDTFEVEQESAEETTQTAREQGKRSQVAKRPN